MDNLEQQVNALNDTSTSIVEWVNHVLNTSTSETDMTRLQQMLQTILFDANRNLDTSMQRVLHSVPTLQDELQRVLKEGNTLSECLQEINSRVEMTYDEEPLDDAVDVSSNVDPLQKLLDLETVLTNMGTTSDKLSHHALWNKTMRDAQQRMYGEDILAAANLLSQLQKTLIVLEELPGHEDRKSSLEALSNEFDNSLRPGLKTALESNDINRLRTYLNIFRNMDDVKGFEDLYVSARCSLLSSTWSETGHQSNERRATISVRTARLKRCFSDIRQLIQQERAVYLPALFQQSAQQDSTHVRILSSIIGQCCRAVKLEEEENESFANTNTSNTSKTSNTSNTSTTTATTATTAITTTPPPSTDTPLPFSTSPIPISVSLKQVLVWHTLVTTSLREMFDEISPLRTGGEGDTMVVKEVDVLTTLIFANYHTRYAEMEKDAMLLEMSSEYELLYLNEVDNEMPQLGELYDILHDNLEGCFSVLRNGVTRCDSLSNGRDRAKLVQAMTSTFLDFHHRIQLVLQKSSKLSSLISGRERVVEMEKESDQVSTSLRLILLLRTHLSNLIDYEDELIRRWSSASNIIDQLAAARKAASMSVQVAIRGAYDICMGPILQVLAPLPSMNQVWSKTFEDDRDRDDFEIYSQLEYATFIGEYLIDLVQKLEPLESMLIGDKSLLEEVDVLRVVEEEWDRTVVGLKLDREHYLNGTWFNTEEHSWLTLISHGTVAKYVTMMTTSMSHLSEYGAYQLSEDVGYLINVTSAMGVTTSPMLSHVHSLLSMERDALQELSDKSEKESRPSHLSSTHGESKSTLLVPRGLLLRICKMRGILTTF